MNDILFVGEHPPTYDVQWHTHDHWELIYCTSGNGMFRFHNGTTLRYREGDAVAIPPGELHANVSQEGFTNIHMRVGELTHPQNTVFRVTDDSERHLGIAFAQARDYFLSDIDKRELVLDALGDLIASYMIVYRDNSMFSGPVDQLRRVILREYARADFALDEAIRALPFNYDYLRKLFKKEIGSSPLEYLTRLRMKKAETMLTTTRVQEYTVAEIAGMCGYDDALYFSRVFKKYYGCSPSAFAREKQRQRE